MDVLVDLVNTLGYPAAITVGMAYFLKYVFDKNSQQSAEMQGEMLDVIKNNTEALSRMKEVVENLSERGDKCENCNQRRP